MTATSSTGELQPQCVHRRHSSNGYQICCALGHGLTEITNGVIRNKTLLGITWVWLLLERRSGGTTHCIGGPNPRSERNLEPEMRHI
jgi:hypothetical protein